MVPVMLPELMTFAAPVLASTPTFPPVMLAPALLVTVALVFAKMAASVVPVMLPELMTFAAPVLACIPSTPYVDGPRATRAFSGSDRIACIHMSGLLMRYETAGQDGFRDTSSNHPCDLLRPMGPSV